jgi:hypothetical protein
MQERIPVNSGGFRDSGDMMAPEIGGTREFWLKRAKEMMAVAEKFGSGLEEDRREAIGLAARCYRNAGMSGLSVVGTEGQ